MAQDPGDEMEGHFRKRDAEALGVGIRTGLGSEEIRTSLEVGERHVVMATRAEVGREGLGHEGRDRSDGLGDALGHEPQKGEPVGRGEGVGVVEIELILAVSALLIEGEKAPAELVHVLRHGLKEVHRLHCLIDVVGGTGAAVAMGRERFPASCFFILAEDIELGLDAEIELQPHGGGPLDLALQDLARVVRIGGAVVVEVAEEVSKAFVPGTDRGGVEIGHGGAFVLLRTDEAHAFHCSDGEELGALGHLFEALDGIDLGLGDAVDVDVAGEQVLHPGRLEIGLELGGFFVVDLEIFGDGKDGL